MNSIYKIKDFYSELDKKDFITRWNPYVSIFIVLVYLITFAAISDFVKIQDKFVRLLISPQTFFLFSLLILMPIMKLRAGELGFSFKNFAKQTSTGIKLSLLPPVLIIFFVLLPLAAYQLINSGQISFLHNFANGKFPFDFVYIVQLLILAPIIEEFFFRGFLIPPLKKILPLWGVMLISSLIFMLAHGYFKPGAFLLGLFTSVIFIKTGSVIPTIIFHFSCNLWGPLLMWLLPGVYKAIFILFR